VIAILVLVVILGGIGIAFALGSKNPPVTTTTVAPTTTEAPSTTTTLPSISHSLTKMVNDVIAGQSTHAIGPQVAQSISNGAQQAVTDLASGNAQAAANDLQGVATSIANGLANGTSLPRTRQTCRPISRPSPTRSVSERRPHRHPRPRPRRPRRWRLPMATQWSGKWASVGSKKARGIARSCSDDVTRPNSKRMQHEHVEARLNLDAPFTKTDCRESIDCAERDPEITMAF